MTLAVLLMSAPTHGAAQTELSGEWFFEIVSESGEPQVRLQVEIAATQDGRLLGATGPTDSSEITGSIKGSDVELLWSADFEGTPVTFTFTGTTMEDGMSGSVVIDFGEPGAVSQSTWTATKAIR